MNTTTVTPSHSQATRWESYARHAESGRRGMTKPLVAKEIRQILPLFSALNAVGLLLHLSAKVNEAISNSPSAGTPIHQTALILVPALFAIGAGALLVSQEKESRTLLWLSSLPIPAKNIVWSKIAVGFGALMCCWLVSAIVALVFSPSIFASQSSSKNDLIFTSEISLLRYLFNSIFLLIASMATAWIFESAWLAIVLVVPIAILPLLATGFSLEWVSNQNDDFAFGILSSIYYSIAAVLLIAVAVRYGRRSFLAPAGKVTEQSAASIAPLLGGPARTSTSWVTQPAIPSLLWQIGWQNRMLWFVGGSLVFWFLISIVSWSPQSPFFPLSGALWFLLISLLGAFTFGSDGMKNRIRFLADRGISPGTVWWTRQLFPISLIGVGAVLTLLVLSMGPSPENGRLIRVTFVPFLVALFLVYVSTQWATQWMRSSLLMLCIAPAVAIGALAYAGFAISALGSHISLVAAAGALMLVASRVMMNPWMDGDYRWRTLGKHVGFLMLVLLIPATPYLLTVTTYRGMSYATRSKLSSLSASQPPVLNQRVISFPSDEPQWTTDPSGISIDPSDANATLPDPPSDGSQVGMGDEGMMSMDGSTVPERLIVYPADWSEFMERRFAALEGSVEGATSADIVSEQVLSAVNAEASLTRYLLLQATDSLPDEKELLLQRYRRALRILHRVAYLYRVKTDLSSQLVADRVEYGLWRELETKESREWLDDEIYTEIASTLANKEARDRYRRVAIAESWATSKPIKNQKDWTSLGGIPLDIPSWTPLLANTIVLERRYDRFAELLLELLNAKEGTERQEILQSMTTFVPISADAAIHEGDTDANFTDEFSGLFLRLWNGKWEMQAQKLVREQ